MDSNHDKELQRLLCYHYTTGQNRHKGSVLAHGAQSKTAMAHTPILEHQDGCGYYKALGRLDRVCLRAPSRAFGERLRRW